MSTEEQLIRTEIEAERHAKEHGAWWPDKPDPEDEGPIFWIDGPPVREKHAEREAG